MKALVTGGGGFLGKAIALRLKEHGAEVRSYSRGAYPELEARGITHQRGDIADASAVLSAAEGCDIVFHTAALPGLWGPYEQFHAANVVGTENVIAACRKHGIEKLIHTSSPSVVATDHDLEGVDESAPYGEGFVAHYPKTKALAEQRVLAANDAELATVALRPHLIWGPGDNHITPRLVARARAGKLRRIGRDNKLVDSIYIDNCVDAHMLAAERLEPGAVIAGKAYFLSQGEPIPCWDLINGILRAAGAPEVTRSIPYGVAYAAGWLLETSYMLLGRADEPPMTRFLAHQMATAHWFDIGAARRDLGYNPKISITEGLARLEQAFKRGDA